MTRPEITAIIFAPLHLANDEDRPEELTTVSLNELCEVAGIPVRVTGSVSRKIVLHAGPEHFLAAEAYYVGTNGPANGGACPANGGACPANGGACPANGGTCPANGGTCPANGGIWLSRKKAFLVLEILAHSFHDYAARETICNQGLFRVPPKRGRPRLQAQPMTAKERMRKMRRLRESNI